MTVVTIAHGSRHMIVVVVVGVSSGGQIIVLMSKSAAQPESVRLSLLTNNCFSFAASVLAAAAVDPNPNPDTKGSPYS